MNGDSDVRTSKMRVACATTSHDVEEGECPWCTIERLKRERDEKWGGVRELALQRNAAFAERDRLTVERNQLIAAIGEHVTVRSDQYALIQRLTRDIKRLTDDATRFCAEATTAENKVTRLTREKAAERGLREGAVRAVEAERDRLLTALKSIRDLRCSAFRTDRQDTEDMRAIASRALALPSEPNSAPETPSTVASNQCNVPPVDDPLGDVDESDVLAEVITGLQAQLNDLAVRYAQQGIEIERLRAALERCRLASGLAKAEIIDAALSGEPGNSAVETSGRPKDGPGSILGCTCMMCEYHRSAEAIERLRRSEKASERYRVKPPKFCAVDGCYNRVADDQEVCDSCSQNGDGDGSK